MFIELYRDRDKVMVERDKIVTVQQGGIHFPTKLFMDNGMTLEFSTPFESCIKSIQAHDESESNIHSNFKVAVKALKNIGEPDVVWVNSAKRIASEALDKIGANS